MLAPVCRNLSVMNGPDDRADDCSQRRTLRPVSYSPAYRRFVLGVLVLANVFAFIDRQLMTIFWSQSKPSSMHPTRPWGS